MGKVTRLLALARQGDARSEAAALEELYDELRAIAARHLAGQPRQRTIQVTALVNEAWLRLRRREDEGFEDRVHFLAFASRAMRSVLVDYARRRGRAKRRAVGDEIPLDQVVVDHEARALDLEALDTALNELESFDPTMARVVNLRFFGGVPMSEIAALLEIPERTLSRRWTSTRAWLRSRIA